VAPQLKHFFSPALVRRLAADITRVHRPFPSDAFVRQATRGLAALELIDRGRHIARALAAHLPAAYPDAIDVLARSLGTEHPTDELLGLGMAPFPHVRRQQPQRPGEGASRAADSHVRGVADRRLARSASAGGARLAQRREAGHARGAAAARIRTPGGSHGRDGPTPARAAIGGRVAITFVLRSTARTAQDLLVDLAVHFVKAGGHSTPRVFKLKRVSLPPRGTADFRASVVARRAYHQDALPRPACGGRGRERARHTARCVRREALRR